MRSVLPLVLVSNTVSGTAVSRPVDPTDGTCASCHKSKIGTFSGTVSGTTPMCSVTVDGTAAIVTESRITGAYSGADSCEGQFTDGALSMARQP